MKLFTRKLQQDSCLNLKNIKKLNNRSIMKQNDGGSANHFSFEAAMSKLSLAHPISDMM